MRAFALSWLLFSVSACFEPFYPSGLACAPDGWCPDGESCDPDTYLCVTEVLPERNRCWDWTPKPTHFDPCTLSPPSDSLELVGGSYSFDTDSGVLEGPQGVVGSIASSSLGENRPFVISVDSLHITSDATLRVVGEEPLIVAAWTSITVDGLIDVSSGENVGPGAGADPPEYCASHGAFPGQSGASGGGGGGGGGGFAGPGGRGGDGGSSSGAGGGGGQTADTPDLVVRGGCPGAKGAVGDGQVGAGVGGAGGGAIQLTARTSMTITGSLHAGGSGGAGAESIDGIGQNPSRWNGGGGGGGSGGMLGLESPQLLVVSGASLAANGGGGGGGCDEGAAESGEDGNSDPDGARGGNGEFDWDASGGNGGGGGARVAVSGMPGDDAARGGGGGGGAAGFIIIRAPELDIDEGAVFSPAPRLLE